MNSIYDNQHFSWKVFEILEHLLYLLSSDLECTLGTVSKMVAKVKEIMAGILIIPTVYKV